ncbi:MAG: alpha-D-ribose 1-methylphosphonate 5-triphosphate diphosphatase [Actinomycetota bacterium]
MDRAPGRGGLIVGGRVLAADGSVLAGGRVAWTGAHLTEVAADPDPEPTAAHNDPTGAAPGVTIDATGCWVLPGIVDVHGDAFERSLMPRSGVAIGPDAALADNDAQLLAAGITTSFLSATDSWEPGLRSRDTLRLLVTALARRPRATPDVQLHVRHERCATDGIDELGGWIDDGTIRMLSYNDHTPADVAGSAADSPVRAARAGVDQARFGRLLAEAIERRPIGAEQERALAEAARAAGCPTASHDAGSTEDLARDLELGVAISEFPMTIELARRYLDEGVGVLLGAPNLVRGTSHLGNLSVRDAVTADALSMLCSDYHYPSLLGAPFVAEAAGLCDVAAAWSMVASAPAAAAGLEDRGRLAVGARADVIVVEPPPSPDGAPVVRAVVSGGALALTRP